MLTTIGIIAVIALGGFAICGAAARRIRHQFEAQLLQLDLERSKTDAIERRHIQFVLEQAMTLEEAAEMLGINVATLWRKRRKYGMD